MKVHFFRWFYFIWLIVPAALLLVYALYGTPYMVWSYSWYEYGQNERFYTHCTYVGFNGDKTIRSHNGKCAFIRFFKKGDKS